MSIATERGDFGETSLPGGVRVSKSDLRVEVYGTIDELISSIGLARSLCPNVEVQDFSKSVQRELFKVGSALAGRTDKNTTEIAIEDEMVGRLTAEVHRIESLEGLLADWVLPGADPASAAFDVARTVCRRAERLAVRVVESGVEVDGNVVRYLNRLSDLLWLFGRQIEVGMNIDAKLRTNTGPRWSRAW